MSVGETRRVVHMTSAHDPDDIRIFAKECRTLAAAGYEVHLIAPGADGHVHDGVRTWPVASAPNGSRAARMTSTVLGVYRRARELGAALYHFHDPELMLAGLRLSQAGAAVVYDAHEDVPATVRDKAWIPALLRRPVARLVDAVEPAAGNRLAAIVAATPAIAERFSRCRCDVVTVNNFPERGEFERVLRPEMARSGAVCFVGGITPIRGIDVAVDAIGRTEATLVLAGQFDPPDFEDRLRLSPGWSRVECVGHVGRQEVAEIFARAIAGIVVFAPAANHVRSQPTKLFEYMSAGLPVVASNFPLWCQIVEGAGCGICVDPTSAAAVADAIRWITEHPGEARAMGENGRRAVASIYNWEHEAGKLTSLYEKLLG